MELLYHNQRKCLTSGPVPRGVGPGKKYRQQRSVDSQSAQQLVATGTGKKQIGAEVLHLYREINLMFNFAEKLATASGVIETARLTLQEAGQVIGFEAGAVF